MPVSSGMLSTLKNIAYNVPGWRTKRKIVVIESDDWGSIRMPSRETYEKLKFKGYPVEECIYNRNDALESNEDLELLYNVLLKFKDKNGNHPIITANTIVANPDFDLIKGSDFHNYHYELFTETLKKYPDRNKVYSYYLDGIRHKIFYPQFHGREHVNIFTWMNALKCGDKVALEIFQEGMFTVHKSKNLSCRNEFLDSFGTHSKEQLQCIELIITDGLNLFENLFGYRSQSFIATCYIWHPEIEQYLWERGIVHIQSGRVQKIPRLNADNYRIKRLFTGLSNKYGQIYTCRNVIFEPSENPDKDWVTSALKEISVAFNCKKPAIISSHRVNYIGSIHKDNRSQNLKSLELLLKAILRKWPDVEFMSSEQLGKLILNSK